MPKFAARIAAAGLMPEGLCAQYLALCGQVPALTITPTCRDPDDDNVLAAALAADADMLVTGDSDLRLLRVFEGIPVYNAAEALALLNQPAN